MKLKDFYKPDYTLIEKVDLTRFSEPLLSVVKEWVARSALTSQKDVNELYKALVDAKNFVNSPTEIMEKCHRLEEARGRIKLYLTKVIGKSVDIYNDPPLMNIQTKAENLLNSLP